MSKEPKARRPASSARDAFAARLRALRLSFQAPGTDKPLSMADFAALIEVEAETYRRYERGETEPNLAVLARIRAVTGINLNNLVAGDVDRAA